MLAAQNVVPLTTEEVKLYRILVEKHRVNGGELFPIHKTHSPD